MIHALFVGRALCGFSNEVPGKWPEGHVWVGVRPGEAVDITEDMRRDFCPACLLLVCSPKVLTIHLLNDGIPICGFERPPGAWQEGHDGVEVTDWSMTPNCPICLSILNRTHKPKTVYDHIRENADEDDP